MTDKARSKSPAKAKPSTRGARAAATKATVRSAGRRGALAASALEEMVLTPQTPLPKVQVSARIDGLLAHEIGAILRERETMSDFVSTALTNEYHRRRGTRAPRELTLAELDNRLVAIAQMLEASQMPARQTLATTRLIAAAVGVKINQL